MRHDPVRASDRTTSGRLTLVAFATAILLGWPAVAAASPAPVFALKWSAVDTTTLDHPYAVASDRVFKIFVADTTNNRIVQYDRNGGLHRAWGSYGGGDGQFDRPMGIAADPRHHVYVADTNNDRIQRSDDSGDPEISWGTHGSGNGQFDQPSAIAIDPTTRFVYVTELGNHRVQEFDQDGGFVRAWGGPGSGDGQFNMPTGIAVGPNGHVYVVDAMNARVQEFTADGTWVANRGVGHLTQPYGIGIDPNGWIHVSDPVHAGVEMFQSDGMWVDSIGTGTGGGADGQFNWPSGVAVDGSGIYVADTDNSRIQRFTLGYSKPVTRIVGADRYGAAVKVAAAGWPGWSGVRHVVIACGEDRALAEPMIASSFAGVLDAPILLVKAGSLPKSTATALARMRALVGPLSVHVIGGTGSIGNAVYRAIKAKNRGGRIERISAADRYSLSCKVALRVKSAAASRGMFIPGVLVFNGQDPRALYDALAATPIAARAHMPMLAVKRTAVPVVVRTTLSGSFATTTGAMVPARYVVNPTRYVTGPVYRAVRARMRLSSSSDRYMSAAMISENAVAEGWTNAEGVGLAGTLPDAVTAGTLVGKRGGVVLFTPTAPLAPVTNAWVSALVQGTFHGWVFGGTGSVSTPTFHALEGALAGG